MSQDDIMGWRFYNHAMIPTTAPHEEADLSPLESEEIWNCRKDRKRPILAVWTSDWDCDYETQWWYVIREKPFDLSSLSSSSRRNIRKAFRNCRVEKIDPSQYAEDLWRVFLETVERYENYVIDITKEEFINACAASCPEEEYWAGFDKESGILIGYAIFVVHDDWVTFHKSRYSTLYLKLRVSDAINAKALDYYLNQKGKRYVTDGMRSVLHKTNFQRYLKEHFGYRNAYCVLHMKYRKPLNIFIYIIYPFRKILKMFDRNNAICKLNALLVMEQANREQRVTDAKKSVL